MTNENTVSDCCNATMRVVGGDEGTNHYECERCGKACDPTNENTHRLLTDEEAEKIEERAEAVEQFTGARCKYRSIKFASHLESIKVDGKCWGCGVTNDVPALLADRQARIEREKKVTTALNKIRNWAHSGDLHDIEKIADDALKFLFS